LHILATSREALGLTGETTLEVPPLGVPDAAQLPPLDTLARSDAVRLFVARARAVLAGFELTPANAAAVAQVCRQLDGIPLAIELAAARVRLLQVEQIATRLGDRFRLLTGGSPTALPRHQTLWASIDWSYDLLDAGERGLLRLLAVFAGRWTLDAAETLGGEDTLERLGQLVNKSLVVVERHDAGEARYRLLETIREYALVRLEEHGEAEHLRWRHAEYYGELARAYAPEWGLGLTVLEDTRTEQVALEQENMRAALHWSMASGMVTTGAALALALSFLWTQSALLAEARRWIERMLERHANQDTLHFQLLLAAGSLAVHQGDTARGAGAYEQAYLLGQRLGDLSTVAWVLGRLGQLAYIIGDTALAAQRYEESLAYHQQRNEVRGQAWVLFNLGITTQDLGQPARTTALFAESLALLRDNGDERLLVQMLLDQGEFLRFGRAPAQATMLLTEGLERARDLGDSRKMARALRELGAMARDTEDYANAVLLLEEALTRFRSCGDKFGIAETLHNFGEAMLLQGNDERAWELEYEALRLWRELGGPLEKAWPLQNLGRIALRRGDHIGASAHFLEALHLLYARQHRLPIAVCLVDLAGAAIAAEPNEQGAWRAARLLGAAEELRETYMLDLALVQRIELERTLGTARPLLDDHTWDAAWSSGRAMSLDEAVAFALHREEQAGLSLVLHAR
jgi:predicted ATPase